MLMSRLRRSEALDPHVASCRIVGGVEEPLTVGRVAALADVSVRTLHHYDEIGLVQPSARTSAGYRAYSAGDVERLREVLAYRRLGFGSPRGSGMRSGTHGRY